MSARKFAPEGKSSKSKLSQFAAGAAPRREWTICGPNNTGIIYHDARRITAQGSTQWKNSPR